MALRATEIHENPGAWRTYSEQAQGFSRLPAGWQKGSPCAVANRAQDFILDFILPHTARAVQRFSVIS
jgi:hypothetical protein